MNAHDKRTLEWLRWDGVRWVGTGRQIPFSLLVDRWKRDALASGQTEGNKK